MQNTKNFFEYYNEVFNIIIYNRDEVSLSRLYTNCNY
nr:MAG TPA: hypothetical protein [Caudoviricetes sp.]